MKLVILKHRFLPNNAATNAICNTDFGTFVKANCCSFAFCDIKVEKTG